MIPVFCFYFPFLWLLPGSRIPTVSARTGHNWSGHCPYWHQNPPVRMRPDSLPIKALRSRAADRARALLSVPVVVVSLDRLHQDLVKPEPETCRKIEISSSDQS